MPDTGTRSTESSRNQHRQVDSIVRVGPLTGIATVLRELGAEPDTIFEGTGFSTAQLADPDTEISYLAASRLLARCAESTACPHYGLLLGMRASASSLGVPGFLLLNAIDVGAALRDLAENLDLHDQGGVLTLQIERDSVLFGYRVLQTGAAATEQIHDLAVAVACNIMRALCGVGWNPDRVLLSRQTPQNLAPYHHFFRAPLQFNTDRNAVEFPSHWLQHRLSRADNLLHRHLEQEASQLHALRKVDPIYEIRRALHTSLLAGKGTVGDVARQLCLHERTLHRRLREQGTSFRQERDNTRHEISRQLLENGTLPITVIATTLGYADVSSFSRAFKRWTGCTPAHWRTRSKAPSRK